MIYEKRIVCYFDLLGFGNQVTSEYLTAENIALLFADIDAIIQEYKGNGIQISHFSDSLLISVLATRHAPQQLRFVRDVLIKLLEYNLTARGAIVYGNIIHTESNAFGSALVKAVKIEELEAKYPRVILDRSLSEVMVHPVGAKEPMTYLDFWTGFWFVKKDADSKPYVDFIGALKELNRPELEDKLVELIKTGVSITAISEKYLWLKDKYESTFLRQIIV